MILARIGQGKFSMTGWKLGRDIAHSEGSLCQNAPRCSSPAHHDPISADSSMGHESRPACSTLTLPITGGQKRETTTGNTMWRAVAQF